MHAHCNWESIITITIVYRRIRKAKWREILMLRLLLIITGWRCRNSTCATFSLLRNIICAANSSVYLSRKDLELKLEWNLRQSVSVISSLLISELCPILHTITINESSDEFFTRECRSNVIRPWAEQETKMGTKKLRERWNYAINILISVNHCRILCI